MNAEQKELFRVALLRVLEANNTRWGLGATALAVLTAPSGFRGMTAEIVKSEMQYLLDKNFVAAVDKKLSPENQTWRITAEGRDFLAEQGE